MWKRLGLFGVIIILAAGLVILAITKIHSHSPQNHPPSTGQHHPPSSGSQGGASGNSGQSNPPSSGPKGGSSGKSGQSNPPSSGSQGGASGNSSQSNPPSSGSKGGSSGNSSQNNSPSSGSQGGASGNSGQSPSPSAPKLVWGVDTASHVNASLYQCVKNHYGKPLFVGRYMTTKNGVYSGLTSQEVKLLHNNGVKILPIYNHFSNAKGKSHGINVANNALRQAKQLGIPKGHLITADIELGKPVDASFLIGWTQTIENAGYQTGIYGNFVNGQVTTAYNQASNQSTAVKNNLILWTNQPSIGITSKSHAPSQFNANSPNLNQTLLWQYGINGSSCNIDTDLAKGSLLKSLW